MCVFFLLTPVCLYFYLRLLYMFVSVLLSSSASHVVQSQYVFSFLFRLSYRPMFFQASFFVLLPIYIHIYTPLFCTYFSNTIYCLKSLLFFVGGSVRGPGEEPWLRFSEQKDGKYENKVEERTTR